MKRGSSRMWSGNSFCIAVVGGRQHSEEGELSEEAHSVSLQSLVLQFRVYRVTRHLVATSNKMCKGMMH